MAIDNHTDRLIKDSEIIFVQFLRRDISAEQLQNGIDAISFSFESCINPTIQKYYNMFSDLIEEIVFMEPPEKQYKLIEAEIKKVKKIVMKFMG